jgi:predicted amidophosphoribosyltransferase
LARQSRSRLSSRGFCQREAISEASVHWWRRKLSQYKQAATMVTMTTVRAMVATALLVMQFSSLL